MNNKNPQGHSERAHALLSASASTRWLNCTPSALLESQFEDKSSAFAEEGTLAHELAEAKTFLRFSKNLVDDRTDVLRQNPLFTPEMDEYTDAYVDYVSEVLAEALAIDSAAIMETEVRVDLTEYIPEGFGTIDNVIIANGVLHVIDLKYGKGVKVSAKDNSQLKLYALGILNAFAFMYDVQTVCLHIHQPRIDNISTFSLPAEDLMQWGQNHVKPTAEKAFKGEGEQIVGSWCGFCKARNRCAALGKEALEVARLDFAEPKLMTDVQLLEVYAVADRLSRWLSGLGDYLLAEALAGKKFEGLKVVEGRSNRKIVDADAVIKALEADGFTREDFMKMDLQGIGALEKLLGKQGFEKVVGRYVVKPSGKPTLVDASDKRPEFTSANDFND